MQQLGWASSAGTKGTMLSLFTIDQVYEIVEAEYLGEGTAVKIAKDATYETPTRHGYKPYPSSRVINSK